MDRQPISIVVLQQALEAKRTQIRALEADAEDLQRAIRQLQGESHEQRPERAFPLIIDGEVAASIVNRQEQAVENEEEYPAEKFKGKTRIAIALELAKDFRGYVATSAFRKILAKPGVLKSTSQVGSVASRVLANSPYFERVWEGLYRDKDYQGEEGMTPSVEGD